MRFYVQFKQVIITVNKQISLYILCCARLSFLRIKPLHEIHGYYLLIKIVSILISNGC